jgi:DNA-directed RNA polymerase specialized sigma24 family protein
MKCVILPAASLHIGSIGRCRRRRRRRCRAEEDEDEDEEEDEEANEEEVSGGYCGYGSSYLLASR